jgi:UDP-N-acetylglucosamine 4,6-dehydratase/5-epimerase
VDLVQVAAQDFPLANLDGRSILITGGTGSFGRALVNFVTGRYAPRRLVIFSRDELKQYEMQQSFNQSYLRYFIGDVRDADRLEMAMRDVDYVIHAAALKQVPTAEYNPFECVRTNIHGAENVVNAAIRSGVKRVIALSTDKATNPINLYGASKLASDKIFVAANAIAGSQRTRFAVVRYGNVIGSRGSIVPHFEKLIASGVPALPITDKRMTRFLIAVNVGVEMVLSSLQMMSGGEVFIPKIPSVHIVDLAEAMMPGGKLEFIGIRPGEKLHEMLISEDDARVTIELHDRYVIEPMFEFWEREHYDKFGAKKVRESFCYASNTNEQWLDISRIRELLQRIKAEKQ